MQERWVGNKVLGILSNHLVDYPTPSNMSYFWSFGSLSGSMLVVQLVTGIFLAMHYTPHVDSAFSSVEHIMRDVNNGWLMRYAHANGASFFFIMVYAHMMRGLYYGSYASPRGHLWGSGVSLFILMMATGFIGYVLPFGQMSLWGATVITNLFSAIPGIGSSLVEFLWGGFSVANPTLNRFFSLHFTLPFILAGLASVHSVLLHLDGSGNPLGVDSKVDKIPFYPYFYVKDLSSFSGSLFMMSLFVFFAPNASGHPDNYIPANPLVTPAHIVPEWYFLSFYAILRSIPHKLLGVVAMFGASIWLSALPYINTSEVRSTSFRPSYKIAYWLFISDCLILGWIGAMVVEYPFIESGQLGTLYYFGFLMVSLPSSGSLEGGSIRGGKSGKKVVESWVGGESVSGEG